jgi:hypothetical protein
MGSEGNFAAVATAPAQVVQLAGNASCPVYVVALADIIADTRARFEEELKRLTEQSVSRQVPPVVSIRSS